MKSTLLNGRINAVEDGDGDNDGAEREVLGVSLWVEEDGVGGAEGLGLEMSEVKYR